MKRKTSLKDIAKKVGVSTATVSYVLSKGKESKVSVGMSEKIKKVAKELNYQPNQIAKSLKSGKTFTIGLIVADISNPFFANFARIIEDEAAHLNYTVIFGSSDEKAGKSWDLIQFLLNRQVDGFIIAPTEGSEIHIQYLKEQHIPFVLIDRYFPKINTNYVVINNYKASYEAVERLINPGNKKIGMLAYDTSLHHMQERIRGYQAAMKDNGLNLKESWLKKINFDNIKEEVRYAIDDILNGQDPVDALFFATNTLAVQSLKYIDELKYKIPADLAIISFDEGEAFDFYYCPLTFVKQPLIEFGKKAVKVLTEQIADPTKKEEHICLNAELIIRKSCGNPLKSVK
ncbi:MAG: LacI family transcriptional regulator [Cytophagaceae bacterium]|nr:LacI family transcriptional regulator [Cytophagaceae bacterium]|tara:strand:+ start:745 stop:1779 length:1035 start_codon:yes stop_codon:yes gene_type:complete